MKLFYHKSFWVSWKTLFYFSHLPLLWLFKVLIPAKVTWTTVQIDLGCHHQVWEVRRKISICNTISNTTYTYCTYTFVSFWRITIAGCHISFGTHWYTIHTFNLRLTISRKKDSYFCGTGIDRFAPNQTFGFEINSSHFMRSNAGLGGK